MTLGNQEARRNCPKQTSRWIRDSQRGTTTQAKKNLEDYPPSLSQRTG
jgi:hypothetical protein